MPKEIRVVFAKTGEELVIIYLKTGNTGQKKGPYRMAGVQKALYAMAKKMEVRFNEDPNFTRYHIVLLGDRMPEV